MGHSAKRVKCETCGRVYCPQSDSVCPDCCLHEECQRQLQQAQEEVERQRRRCKNTALAWAHASEMQDAAVQLRVERAAASERGVAVIQAARILAYQRHMARLSQGWWYRRFGEAQERAEAAENALVFDSEADEALTARVLRLETAIGRWVMAYGPDLVVYPSKEEIRAVNETPEFRIGRNATMQVVSEGLQAILDTPAEASESAERTEGGPR